MNTMHKKRERYLNRFEFSFSKKRIKVSEPRYIDLHDGVITIIRDFDGFSLFVYQGIIFIVYFLDKNEDLRKKDTTIPTKCVWEICIVNKDKTIQKVREAKRLRFIERHIQKYVRSEANAIF